MIAFKAEPKQILAPSQTSPNPSSRHMLSRDSPRKSSDEQSQPQYSHGIALSTPPEDITHPHDSVVAWGEALQNKIRGHNRSEIPRKKAYQGHGSGHHSVAWTKDQANYDSISTVVIFSYIIVLTADHMEEKVGQYQGETSGVYQVKSGRIRAKQCLLTERTAIEVLDQLLDAVAAEDVVAIQKDRISVSVSAEGAYFVGI
ncbi:hypothetical protein PRZ48_004558 [Zasmidium cellare]|uniref:Uncharacterized protein n=1 Tax=Zasmidium cellare TaxID=395010 RepID=A0ABR0ER10_ZASCE|nr:hypothetical protein PRZ48_004558 [Zasmidium cellare]